MRRWAALGLAIAALAALGLAIVALAPLGARAQDVRARPDGGRSIAGQSVAGARDVARDGGARGGVRDGIRDGGVRDAVRDGGVRDAVRDGGVRDALRDGGVRDALRDGSVRDGGVRDALRDGGVRDGVGDGGAPDGSGVATAAEGQTDPEGAELPEGHRPEVSLRIDPREGLVTGDLVHVFLTVRLPEGDDVNVPRQAFGPFELHAQRHHDAPIEGGRREFGFELDLLALEPGEHELPALQLRVITADGTVGTVRTEPQRIRIGSLVANEPDAQPRPATRPVPVMQDDYTLAWVLGILGSLMLTAILTWLLARWWSRRPRLAPPPPPPKPAWDTALAKLDALRRNSTAMLEKGEHVALVDGVSDALREYLGARYDFNGLESTTDEVIARVKQVRLGGATVPEITALLSDCDLVKFAKAVPAQQQCEEMIAGAIRIVRATMPSAMPAIQPPAAKLGGEPAKGAGKAAASERPRPAERGKPIELPLLVDRVDAIDAVLGAAVMGLVGARAQDPAWDGTIVVRIGSELGDEYAVRMALRAVHEKIAKSAEAKRPGARVVIEHRLAGGALAVYGPGAGEERKTPPGSESESGSRVESSSPAESGSGTGASRAEPGASSGVEASAEAGAAIAQDALPSGTLPALEAEPRPTPTGNAFDDRGKKGGGA